jgi:hypothetical protein
MSRSKPNRSPLGDFDVITGPPAPPTLLQKPAEVASAKPPSAGDAQPSSDRRAEPQ